MQNGGLSIGNSTMGDLEAFVVDANEVINFRLIKSEADLKSEAEVDFQPEMTHQIYGENENIFGYRNLRVDFYMAASTLKVFLRMTSDETVTSKVKGVKADQVLEPILKLLAPDQTITGSLEEFQKYISSDKEIKFSPFGEKIDSYDVKVGGKSKTFEIYLADETVPGFPEYHERLQPWIMFYIDAASYIDIDDKNWKFFLMYEKFVDDQGRTRYAITGYTTVFEYYGYPANIRPRISQMLVLPPYQRQGLGAKLLNTVNKHYWNNPKVLDITVEDPSVEFVRLRDFVDVTNCLEKVPCFGNPEKVKAGFTDQMVKESNEKLKLCRRQVRRVYEIIRLHWVKKASPLNPNTSQYKSYRLDVKKRLNLPFKKEEHQLSKLSKVLTAEEYAAATANITNPEQRKKQLEAQYNELEEHYLAILERIAAH